VYQRQTAPTATAEAGAAASTGATGETEDAATQAERIVLSSAAVIARAEEEDAALLVVELDTPGGLDSAMRQMVQGILKTRVPVAVYVSPQGARSASAGVLITLAAELGFRPEDAGPLSNARAL
jgi:membrane-bound ClpP family serine protease